MAGPRLAFDRTGLRIGLILVTLGTEFLLLVTVISTAVARAASGRDELELDLRLLQVQMPLLAVGALACIIGSRWSLRLAIVVGFVLLGIETAMIVHGLSGGGGFTWIIFLLELPAAIVLGGAWLMGRSRTVPRVAPPPLTGDWR